MKALQGVVLCVIFVIANGFVGNAHANFKWDYFLLGTLGLHTSDGNAFTGITGYVGGGKTNKGFGVLGSYEVGSVDSYGYDVRLQLINVYLTGSYKIGNSTIFLSYGVSNLIASVEEEEERVEKSGDVVAITYTYDHNNRFIFMGQVRAQGRGLMLSAGVGF